MHPMDFYTTLTSNGGVSCGKTIEGVYYETCFEGQISELYEICQECAKFCGGSFTMEVSKEVEINDLPMGEYNEDTYMQECGMKKIRQYQYSIEYKRGGFVWFALPIFFGRRWAAPFRSKCYGFQNYSYICIVELNK